jgi:two-component system response regulator MtrA
VKILLADHDVGPRDQISLALRRDGHRVSTAADGREAIRRWATEKPELVLLNKDLPTMNGLDVCRYIRQQANVPIIMLAERDDDAAMVRALQVGADDFVSKPAALKLLVARVQAIVRRYSRDVGGGAGGELRVGGITLNLHSHETTRGDISVHLTPLEFRILYALVMNVGRVIPYSRLVDLAWDYDSGDPELLKAHVCHIRSKLRMPPGGDVGIKTVRSVGYCFIAPNG